MYDTFTVYNQFSNISNFSINVINYLIDNNENIWKLLKYNTNDALSQNNLSTDEKTNLIYSGSGDEQDYRVFTKAMSEDATENQCTQLRVFLNGLLPLNQVKGQVNINIQVISHTSTLILDDYRNRNEIMLEEVISTLNGRDIKGVTRLSFDEKGNGYNNKAQWFKFGEKWYEGYQLVMSCKVGGNPNE